VSSAARAGLVRGSTGFAARAAIQGCMMAVTIAATRRLSIADFGSFAIASSMMLLARNLFYVGPYEFYLKSSNEAADRRRCLTANVALALGSSAVLLLFALASRPLFGTDAVALLLVAMTPALFIAAWTSIYEAEMLRAQRVTLYYVITVLGEVVAAVAAIGWLLTGIGPVALVAQIYGRLLTLALCYPLVLGLRWRFSTELAAVGEVLRWSWSRFGATTLNFLSNYGADLVLGAVMSPAATGIYRAGNRIVSAIVDLFVQPLFKMAQANVSARAARNLPANGEWLIMSKGGATIAWATLAALAVTAPTFVPWLLGEHWLPAVPVVQLFCLFKAPSLLDATTTSLLVARNEQRYTFRVQALVCVASVVAVAVLAPFGTIAVVIGNGFALIALSIGLAVRAAQLSCTSAGTILRAVAGSARAALFVTIMLSLVPSVLPALRIAGDVVATALLAALTLLGTLWLERRQLARSFRSLGGASAQLEPA